METRYWIDIAIGVCTIAAGALTSSWVGTLNAAKFEGASGERFKAIDDKITAAADVSEKKFAAVEKDVEQRFTDVGKDIERLEQVDRDQWKALSVNTKEVTDVRERVSKVEGRLNGKAHSAGI